jgi:hypothetical protein
MKTALARPSDQIGSLVSVSADKAWRKGGYKGRYQDHPIFENDVSFWCATYIFSEEEYNPGLCLYKETTALFSSLRPSLNVGLYYSVGNDYEL